VLLDGQPVPTDVTNWVESVDYHELSVSRTNLTDGAVTNRLVRFIVQSERGDPENGLIRWTPYPLINSTAAEFAVPACTSSRRLPTPSACRSR